MSEIVRNMRARWITGRAVIRCSSYALSHCHSQMKGREEDMRLPITAIGDDFGCPTCEGITLEAAFVETDAPRATVLVYRVDLSRASVDAIPAGIVKFSDDQYAIPRCGSLKPATPQYYRDFEGDAEGIRDEMEAQYREVMRTAFAKTGALASLRGFPSLTGHVIRGVDGFWIFCASVRPPSSWRLEQLRRRFGAERVTNIADPSAFARELGAAFAAQVQWPGVELSFEHKQAAELRPPELRDRIVWVQHGPVWYSDDPGELVESLPNVHRGAVVPFIKRRMFEWQQEYRFTVGVNRRATENEWFLPITPKLRRLAQLGKRRASWIAV